MHVRRNQGKLKICGANADADADVDCNQARDGVGAAALSGKLATMWVPWPTLLSTRKLP